MAIDQREADILSLLHPELRKKVEKLLESCRAAGIAVYIFEGLRSIERQRELYAKGRNAAGVVIDKKAVVTNAKPGSSYHNYGLAVDLVFDGDTEKPGVQWTWDNSKPWAKMGALSEAAGLEWAGRWKTFPEMPHSQLKIPGIGIHELQEFYRNGGMDNVWAKVDEALGLNPLS